MLILIFISTFNFKLQTLAANLNYIELFQQENDPNLKALLSTIESSDEIVDFYSSSLDLLIKYPTNYQLKFNEGPKFIGIILLWFYKDFEFV